MIVKIASAQYPISYHSNWDAWEQHTENWVKEACAEKASLLVFPEYACLELVSLLDEKVQQDIVAQISLLQDFKSDYCSFFERLAKKYKVAIVAPSFPIQIENKTVNRCFVFSEKGLVGYQDKFFMTRFETETWGITSGEKILTLFEADWGCFGIQICYDIEFPMAAQLLAQAGAHVILAPSCTETLRGASRVHVGARARALENQVYTVVSQTVGEALWSPAVDINFGFAGAYSTPDLDLPETGIFIQGKEQELAWTFVELDINKIEKVRKEGQVLNFKDFQEIKMTWQGENVPVQKIRL